MASAFLPALNNLGISMGVMLIARQIPFDRPDILLYTRVGYVVAQAIILSSYYFAASVIRKKSDLSLVKFVEPANPMTSEAPKLKTMTVRDYDLSEVAKSLRSSFLAMGMMTFLHLYLGYTQPLFQQAILGIKALYDAKELKLHVLGLPAEGDLKRPFKAGGFFSAGAPQTDAASIAEAEKSFGSREEY